MSVGSENSGKLDAAQGRGTSSPRRFLPIVKATPTSNPAAFIYYLDRQPGR
jgi:hypothetical protein